MVFYYSCNNKKTTTNNNVEYSLIEKFIDSTNSGEKGETKIEVEKFLRNDDSDAFVIINFYQKEKELDFKSQKYHYKWYFKDKLYFEASNNVNMELEIKDFNNDGYNDFTYHSFEAARGSNEVRKLFIYDKVINNFVYIKNSEEFPNLFFNEELNCINSFIFTGSTTTVFLKIEKDSLKEFASVDFSNKIKIFETEKNGANKLINEIEIDEKKYQEFKPFINYKPLKQ